MTDAIVLTKRGYVGLMRLMRRVVSPFGLLETPADIGKHRYRHWFQSLFAIYDTDELIRQDVPWWTYDAIARVDRFLQDRNRPVVFEYGSGASTVWLARRAHRVISVDHDAFWAEQLQPRLAGFGNVTPMLVPPDEVPDADVRYHSHKPGYRGRSFKAYVEAIDHWPGDFDLIVIDGRARPACLMKAVGRLADDGLIVFDNSHRRHYQRALSECGLVRTVTRGLVPSLPYPDQTTLLRPDKHSAGR